MVRPRSATPLSAGSNPACTSKKQGHPCGVLFFSFGGVGFGFELGPVRFALRDAGAHIRLSNRCPLVRYRERRDIFAIGEYPACSLTFIGHPQGVSFLFWWRRSHFVSTFRRAKHKECRYCHSGRVRDRRSALLLITLFSPRLARFHRWWNAHTPLEDRKARFSDSEAAREC